MRRIAVVNHKGGTGKTTTAVHLAAGLAESGHRVLLVDLDPQGNVGQWFGLDGEDVRMTGFLQGGSGLEDAVVEVRPGLDVLASDWRLADAEESLIRGREREAWLANRLGGVDEYDFAIVDCAPSMSILTSSAIAFADEVVIPISMEYLSLFGVRQIIENILRMTAAGRGRVRIVAVVPTFYQKNLRKSGEILDSLRSYFPGVLTEPIRVNVRLSEAPSHQKTIYEYSPRSRGAEDYRRLVARFVKG